MGNLEVDTIVKDFKGLKSGSDFSHVNQELRDLQSHDAAHWKQNLNDINKRVNMKDLGFSEDFQIVEFGDKGKVLTMSADGAKLQTRDSAHLTVLAESGMVPSGASVEARADARGEARADAKADAHAAAKPAELAGPPHPEKWGKHDVRTNPDGSAGYTIKPGDTLTHIAKDVLAHQLGHPASSQEVAAKIAEIAKANGITNPDHIVVGRELHIPGDKHAATSQGRSNDHAAEKPKPSTIDANTVEFQPKGDVHHPLTPPGLNPDRDGLKDDPQVATRKKNGTCNADGTTTDKYSGKLDDGVLHAFRTEYSAERVSDANGHLLHSKIEYKGSGAHIKLDDGKGGNVDIPNAKSVETKFNDKTGNYETTVTTADGGEFKSTTGADGRVASMKQTKKPEPIEIPYAALV